MHDRVVDRSAAHAAPALLAVRDRLLVALAFSAGIFEAICFLSFGKVFSGFQTGNNVFLGVVLSGTRPPVGPQPVTVVVSLAAFAAGAVVAVPILRSFNGDEEVEDDRVFQVWPRCVSIALGVALAAQVSFLAVWITNSPSLNLAYIPISLNAFAMGLQMNAIRSLHVPGISTTAATATFISLVSAFVTRSLKKAGARRLTGVTVAVVAGAALGDFMLSSAHAYAPLPPVLVTVTVTVIASIALRQEPAAPAGSRRLTSPYRPRGAFSNISPERGA
ncbi:MAG TPA: YoaK family protein [Streptosporangiaceae bacterium]